MHRDNALNGGQQRRHWFILGGGFTGSRQVIHHISFLLAQATWPNLAFG
jgi:hypothetical protein